jgi:GR25 family glycosyltransferase involved in LPS biosynthesis
MNIIINIIIIICILIITIYLFYKLLSYILIYSVNNRIRTIDTFSKQTRINPIDIPVFYINLDRSIERNNYLINELNKYKVENYKRISAVDGSKIKNTKTDTIDDITFINNYNKIKNNEIGCTLSHIKAIYNMYINNYNTALIVEDDSSFILSKLWKYKLSELIKNVPPDWGIIQLWCSNIKLTDNKLYREYNFGDFGAVAYLINRKGANDIIKNTGFPDIKLGETTNGILYPPIGVADSFIYELTKTYVLNVPLIIPFNNLNYPSTIQPTVHSVNTLITVKNILDYYIKTNDIKKL